jgi:pSer/pThr/pTyr-binding forkhead associated (FHA) protein
LVVVDAPDRREIGRAVALQPGTTAIGRSRSKGNHLVLNDESCSSVHARIDVEPRPGQEPAFVLYDAGSKNGVRVANVASQAGQGSRVQRHELRDGDRILMGETALVFKRI